MSAAFATLACTATALPPWRVIVGDDPIGAFLAGGVVDDDGGARLGQVPGDGGPDPLGSPGDDGHLVC